MLSLNFPKHSTPPITKIVQSSSVQNRDRIERRPPSRCSCVTTALPHQTTNSQARTKSKVSLYPLELGLAVALLHHLWIAPRGSDIRRENSWNNSHCRIGQVRIRTEFNNGWTAKVKVKAVGSCDGVCPCFFLTLEADLGCKGPEVCVTWWWNTGYFSFIATFHWENYMPWKPRSLPFRIYMPSEFFLVDVVQFRHQ